MSKPLSHVPGDSSLRPTEGVKGAQSEATPYFSLLDIEDHELNELDFPPLVPKKGPTPTAKVAQQPPETPRPTNAPATIDGLREQLIRTCKQHVSKHVDWIDDTTNCQDRYCSAQLHFCKPWWRAAKLGIDSGCTFGREGVEHIDPGTGRMVGTANRTARSSSLPRLRELGCADHLLDTAGMAMTTEMFAWRRWRRREIHGLPGVVVVVEGSERGETGDRKA